jgi:hypothetical protein
MAVMTTKCTHNGHKSDWNGKDVGGCLVTAIYFNVFRASFVFGINMGLL